MSALSSSLAQDASGGLAPREARTNAMLAAVVECAGERWDVFLRNVSTSGAMMEGRRLPSTGDEIRLVRGDIRIGARVVWRQERRCGVHFHGRVAVAEMMRRVVSANHQARIDQLQQSLRAGLVVPEPAERRAVQRDAAADFGYACRLVETLGDDLTADAYILSRYGTSLQKLDELMQLLKRLETRFVGGE